MMEGNGQMPEGYRTTGYQAMLDNYRIGDDGDKWGNSSEWLFSIAEVMYHNQMFVPPKWEFTDSPMHSDAEWTFDPQGYVIELLREMLEEGEIDEADLTDFGNLMWRYRHMLVSADEDY
jgi:hypothetical protein